MKRIFVMHRTKRGWSYINDHSVEEFSRCEKKYNQMYQALEEKAFVLASNKTEARLMAGGGAK